MKPCKQCPWRRTVVPGALGGSPVETYLGQVCGPFVLPCHNDCDFSDPNWKGKVMETLQCAGAAIFRTHIHVAEFMPSAILTLPASSEVFSNVAEFMAHHKSITVPEAWGRLEVHTLSQMVDEQLSRQTNKFYTVPRRVK